MTDVARREDGNLILGQREPVSTNRPAEGRIVEKKTWTIAEIKAMSAQEYAKHMSDKNFIAAIDALGNETPATPQE